jgi:NAD(P)-dependent dehydrogenase (short-subunit alcohol dehydrogenase family)
MLYIHQKGNLMSVHFAGKVVLVTGASRGIGPAVALAFAREGAALVLAARSGERPAEVAEECRLSWGARRSRDSARTWW